MSYQEKRTIVNIITGAVILAAYCVYAFNQYTSGEVTLNNLEFWARTMLIFIGIGVVATIIIQIVFHILLSISIAVKDTIVNGQSDDKAIEKTIDAEMVEDEMGRLIELKSLRVGFAMAGIGFVVGLISLVLNFAPAIMLNILFISISLGSIFEGGVQLFYYRTGIRNA